jgi:COMPASS component SWD3
VSVKVLRGHTNFVFCLNYNPASSILASGGFDESVRLWDVARGSRICVASRGCSFAVIGKTVRVIPAHSDPVTAVQFSHDGALIVSCAMDGMMRVSFA